MTEAPAQLEARDVSVRFGGLLALDGVSVRVVKGEVLGLIGPNGSGKTTLLNVLSGFIRPASGRIFVEGKHASGWSPRRLARNGVGRTFQGVRLFRRLSVYENVLVAGLGTRGLGKNPRRGAADLLELMDLSDVGETPAGALSYGMQRRVALARTLATDPRFLLLDEPAAGLNEAESDELIESVRGVQHERKCAVMIIEHDVRLIMRLCDRIHVLDYGRTLAEGTPAEVRSNPKVVEAYLGSSA